MGRVELDFAYPSISRFVLHMSNPESAEIMIGTDYADDRVLHVNKPAQSESLLRSLEQVAGSIGLYVYANKTEPPPL